MEKFVILKKTALNTFINKLSTKTTVVAPTKKGEKNFAFSEITNADEVCVNYIPTILPPKKYFIPQKETVVKFDRSKNEWTPVLEQQELTIFGVHTCDLAGIQCLNIVFTQKPKDANYIARNNKITIIGLECNDYCDKYASCAVVDNHLPKGGYDLFFTDLGEKYIVHVNTYEGEGMIENTNIFQEAASADIAELEELRAKKRIIFQDEVKAKGRELKRIFENSMDSKVWRDLDKRCLACGNCTSVCPTCYCFNIIDEIDLNLNTGKRVKVWDSCQNEEFAKVAGNENFREERGQRQRHRYMRKFNYPLDRFNRCFCTGCGRCSRTCMAGISMKGTINSLTEEQK
jgi:sulfhydrogenase subunit beta (sulfur reductase)